MSNTLQTGEAYREWKWNKVGFGFIHPSQRAKQEFSRQFLCSKVSQWLDFSRENHLEILVQDPLEEKQNLRKCTRKKKITNNSGMDHVIDSFKGNVCSWLWLHLLTFFPNRLKENGRQISFTKARKYHLQSILNSQMNWHGGNFGRGKKRVQNGRKKPTMSL